MRVQRWPLRLYASLNFLLCIAQVSVLVIGLDNSGKTTIIQRLRMARSANPAGQVNTTPTVGFNVEEFQKGCAVPCAPGPLLAFGPQKPEGFREIICAAGFSALRVSKKSR